MAIGTLPFSFINGQVLDANQVDADFTALVAALNVAFSPLTSGQSISSLFPLSKANGGTGQTSVILLQQRTFAQTTTPANFNSATPAAFLSASFTPISGSSHILIRATCWHVSQVIAGASSNQALMGLSIRRAGSALVSGQSGSATLTGASSAGTLQLGFVPSLEWYEASPGTSAVTYALYLADLHASGVLNQAQMATLTIEEYL